MVSIWRNSTVPMRLSFTKAAKIQTLSGQKTQQKYSTAVTLFFREAICPYLGTHSYLLLEAQGSPKGHNGIIRHTWHSDSQASSTCCSDLLSQPASTMKQLVQIQTLPTLSGSALLGGSTSRMGLPADKVPCRVGKPPLYMIVYPALAATF